MPEPSLSRSISLFVPFVDVFIDSQYDELRKAHLFLFCHQTSFNHPVSRTPDVNYCILRFHYEHPLEQLLLKNKIFCPRVCSCLYPKVHLEKWWSKVLLAPYKGRGIVHLMQKERKVCIYGNCYCIAHYCCATSFSARCNGNRSTYSHPAFFK